MTFLTGAGALNRDQAKRTAFGYTGECYEREAINASPAFASGDCRALLCGFNPGDVITNIVFCCVTAIQTITLCKVGVWNPQGQLIGSSINLGANIAAGYLVNPLSVPLVIPSSAAYLGLVLAATTMGTIGAMTSVVGKGSALGAGPLGCITLAGQADIPANLGATASNQFFWFGWN